MKKPLATPAAPVATGFNVPGYEKLADVLQRAYDQAARGKGKERHANADAFEAQPMSTINEMLGTHDGYLYQAVKKVVESKRLPAGRDVSELYGAIVYIAGAIMHLERARPASESA